VLDIRRIRTELDVIRAAEARRGDESVDADLDRVAELDRRQRALAVERDELRARINTISKEVGPLLRDGKQDDAEALQAESRSLGESERQVAAEHDQLANDIRDTLLRIPNLPAEDAPDGKTPSDNVVVRTVGRDPASYGTHQRMPHWEIGADLGILDLERAVKLSGSMFVMYRGLGARLVRALTHMTLDRHTSGSGAYEEVRPPTLVKTDTMISTGHLPKFVDEAYHVERDELWLIPTAEVPLTSMARDEIIDEADLPLRFCAYTPCFRREAGSAGTDTRGLLRSHEFDKVELFSYSTPEQASEAHADILRRAEAIVTDLGLTYRLLDLCTGDLGFSSARTFDIDVYAPGLDRWLEVSSVSWYADFQARRANVRYRPAGSKQTAPVHTCNGSALAWPRIVAALLESNRQPDGSVVLPEILHPYLGGAKRIEP
jgi:seryl-tRNA synthetase